MTESLLDLLIPKEITECAVHVNAAGACSSDTTVDKIGHIIGTDAADAKDIITAAKEKLSCETEKCVLETLAAELGPQLVKAEITTNFKTSGPRDSALLSNYNIDDVLKQWSKVYTDFYPYNFNMLNYMSYSFVDGRVVNKPDSLATVHFGDLYTRGYRKCACVINSDRYQGNGKHWMVLFADASGPRWTVEFFNSSGNAPAPEWVSWMVKTQKQMQDVAAKLPENRRPAAIEVVRVSKMRHQKSKSECGVYSLFYIYARINGAPVEYFTQHLIEDRYMFEFRQHLFVDNKTRGLEFFDSMKKFDYDKYRQVVKIEWEKD